MLSTEVETLLCAAAAASVVVKTTKNSQKRRIVNWRIKKEGERERERS